MTRQWGRSQRHGGDRRVWISAPPTPTGTTGDVAKRQEHSLLVIANDARSARGQNQLPATGRHVGAEETDVKEIA